MLLSCPLCCKPHFEGVDSLRTRLINVATAPLSCPVCQETLKGLDKLTIHLFGHVTTNQASPSNGESIKENGTVPTTATEEIDKTIHNVCTSHSTLLRHDEPPQSGDTTLDEGQKSNDGGVIVCDICSFEFTDRNILEMHQELLHQTKPDEKTGICSFHCHLCSKQFRMKGSLMLHLKVAHYGFNNHLELRSLNDSDNNNNEEQGMVKERGAMDADSANNQPLIAEKMPQDTKQWSCDVCTKLFTTKYFLKKHKRLHTGEMPYSCTICNKSFTFQQSYHKHMLYHSSEKPYVCTECGRAFKEHSTLQNHARIHSGERPFGCEICGKRFRQRVSFLVHMRIHTGVMPYKCTACNKSFRYKVSQRSHRCPINPPGSVIRISDVEAVPAAGLPSENEKTSRCIMSVDYDTGNINLIPPNNGSQPVGLCVSNAQLNDDYMLYQNEAYTEVTSPILPEVEGLCLSSNSPVSHSTSPVDESIQIIREKCLEELFQ